MRAACAGPTGAVRALLVGVVCVVLAGIAVWAVPRGAAAASHPTLGAPSAEERARYGAQARYYAERLRESPVFVSDQVPRAVPRSEQGEFAAQLERVDVPMYVLVVPSSVSFDERQLLRHVQRALGERGVYVLVQAGGSSSYSLRQHTYGVDVPAEQAARTSGEWLPRDASSLDRLTYFVDGLLAGGDGSGDGDEADSFYTTRETRETHSITLGVLTAVAVLGLVYVGLAVWLRHRRLLPWVWSPLLGAVVLALLLPLGGQALATETRASGAKDPTARDMRLRAERVADGLRRDGPVYVEEEAAPSLSASQRRSLRESLGELEVPVHLVALHFNYEDESRGRPVAFAERLHRAYGESGLYVVVRVDAYIGAQVTLANYGAPLAREELMDLDESVRFGDRARPDHDAEESRLQLSQDALFAQLTRLTEHIDNTPTGPPGTPEPTLEVEDPVESNTLPPLLSDRFRSGLVGGAVGMALLGLVLLWTWASRRDAGAAAAHALREAALTLGGRRSYAHAPTRPRGAWLRGAARTELSTLSQSLERFTGAERSRSRAWDCLDAATLLLDREGRQRVDADARVCDLATGLALVRAGQAELDAAGSRRADGGADRLCGVNPLHGVASAWVNLARKGTPRQSRRVCPACAQALNNLPRAPRDAAAQPRQAHRSARPVRLSKAPEADSGATVPGRSDNARLQWVVVRELRLPLPQGKRKRRALVPYTEHPGLLGRVASGGGTQIVRLLQEVKEELGVHV